MSKASWMAVLVLLWASGARAEVGNLAALAWLCGCWAADGAEQGSGEHWMPLAGGTLLGVSRTVQQGRTVAHEFLQIRAGDDGRLVYIAEPSGQARTVFTIVRQSASEAVFENLMHDFPQRVAYRLDAPTSLVARIEGLQGGQPKVIEFPMRRVSCQPAPTEPAK